MWTILGPNFELFGCPPSPVGRAFSAVALLPVQLDDALCSGRAFNALK